MMSASLWQLAIHSVRCRVQFGKRVGLGQVLASGVASRSRCIPKSLETWICWRFSVSMGYRSTIIWQQIRELATSVRRPSGRVLLSGAIAFLWERERIGNDDAISCLKEYDDRVKSQFHVALAQSPIPVSQTSEQEVTDNRAHFRHQLQIILQCNSEKHLSQLPLVGLQKMGLLSNLSIRAVSALHSVIHVATYRLSEAKVLMHVYRPHKSNSSCKDRDICSNCKNTDIEQMSEVYLQIPIEDEECKRCHQDIVTNVTNECLLLTYYSDHSNRHTVSLPIVGLRPTGPVYSLSVKIADSCCRMFGGESNLHSQALFLTHFGHSLCDFQSISPFPLIAGLQVNSATLINEGFTIKDALDSSLKQARSSLTTCTSPSTLIDAFAMSGHEGGMKSSVEECHEKCVKHVGVFSSANKKTTSHHLQTASSERNLPTDTDSFLKESGWERFADAQNCTVYRKQHLSGLYVYKVVGSYFDISVKDFVDVQADHKIRKSWDTYVQKLETVDVDQETGTEVVHWIMDFPFPMSSREYVYVRRVWMNRNFAVIINRSVDHPAVPTCRKYIRVQDYVSQTVMHPHATTDQDGFDFELTYYDNPQTNLPSSCVNWVAIAAMPDFLTKVHVAASNRKIASFSNSSGLLKIKAV